MVLGRIATALHPASSSVGRVPDITAAASRTDGASRVGRGGLETNHDTDREGEDDANSVRDQRG
jgi:hypothetical protein